MTTSGPGRNPPRDVLRQLRQEVGFCCPVQECGCPYLTWHHFDPPWRNEHHHRPEGMIALCRHHADEADHGAFTNAQLRALKRTGRQRAVEVRGRLDWMRRDLLTVLGGAFSYQDDLILTMGTQRCIWFNRDDDGYLLLNFKMPTLAGKTRATIEDNVWSVVPEVDEVICPPSGRLVDVNYGDGDHFRAEFFPLDTASDVISRYPNFLPRWTSHLDYPLTALELTETTAHTLFQFFPDHTSFPGVEMAGYFSRRNRGGSILITLTPENQARLFPEH
jgi:hypothetical protein